MILGLDGYTLFHVAISLVGIAVGFVVLGGFLANVQLGGAIHTFLATTVATDVTGFLFPFNGFLPSYAVGAISLVILAVAIYAYYARTACRSLAIDFHRLRPLSRSISTCSC